MKDKSNVLVIILIVTIIIGSLYYLITSQEDNNSYLKEEVSSDLFNNVSMMHFNHMPITYFYHPSCVGPIIPRLEWAFNVLSNVTINKLKFQKINNNSADIYFICSAERNAVAVGFFTTEYTYGLASITDSNNSAIIKTQIQFWSVRNDTRPPSCQYFPSLEIHEILHVFGFNHMGVEKNPEYNIRNEFSSEYITTNKFSIMYPLGGSSCVARNETITYEGKTFKPEDKIDDEIVSCLNYIYSNAKEGSCAGIGSIEEENLCKNGWFPVEGTEYCCPEQNMKISLEGNCVQA